MIFALLDYWNYRRKAGRFARGFPGGVMAGAWITDLPEPATELLRPGDVLLVEGMGSVISWLVMYLTSSKVSHLATYLSPTSVIHSTLSGVREDSLDSLFERGSRVLPISLNVTEDHRRSIIARTLSLVGTQYGFAVVIRKAVRILDGRDWHYFRWKFAADICIPLVALNAVLLPFGAAPWTGLSCLAYLAVIACNYFLWRIIPTKNDANWGKPCDFLEEVVLRKDSFIVDAENLQKVYPHTNEDHASRERSN